MPYITIDSYYWDNETGQIKVYVRYIRGPMHIESSKGDANLTRAVLSQAYMNDTLDDAVSFNPQVIEDNQTSEITFSKRYTTKPTQIKVRVATSSQLISGAELTDPYYAIHLADVDWNSATGKIRVLVKNTGDDDVTLSEVYVNGISDDTTIPNPKVLSADQTFELTLSETYWDTHTQIPIKVSTLEGAADEQSHAIYEVWIQSINWNQQTGAIVAYVYGRGYEAEKPITSVYVNGTLDAAATIHGSQGFYTVTLSANYPYSASPLTLKVVTADGAVAERTQRPYAY